MNPSLEKLRDLVVAPGHITLEDFNRVVTESEAEHKTVAEVLVEKDLIGDSQLGKLLAETSGWRFLDLARVEIDEKVLHLIPELVARKREVVALDREGGGIRLGLTNPADLEIIDFLERRLGEKVIPYYLTARGLSEAISHYRGSLKSEFDSVVAKLKPTSEHIDRDARSDLTIHLVDLLLQYGYQNKASDIHIEPYKEKVLVRFRIDGVMHDVLEVPKTLSEVIITRIKILAKMRTDEHRAAQDGKLQFSVADGAVDVRVSILPVTEGENVVLRLLSEQSRRFGLADLGLGEADLGRVKKAIGHPHGMILVTGPTGSGKTTTVYAVLKILNTRDVHIATIEDPVEYDMEGISQIQVNPKTNLTFASGLRAIVRQDPDIIVVGEIRDPETAGIAVNSAMTGHLVLTTLHANDAATTMPRLLDMGIEPFLVASTVNVVIAQRLVRHICDRCRVSAPPSAEEKRILAAEPGLKQVFKAQGYPTLTRLTFYRGKGCESCGRTGYRGRIGIFEVMEMNENLKHLVVQRSSSNDLTAIACKAGMTTMLEDGIAKVLAGQTTLEEVLRVTKI